jgi:ribonuclease Z
MQVSSAAHGWRRSVLDCAMFATLLPGLALFAGAAQARAETQTPSASSVFRITLLGTGNPRPTEDRFGPSSLVEAGPHRVLIDAGRGATIRLLQAGGRDLLSGIDLVLLTHLHSDHTVGLPDLWLTGWIFGRDRPLDVYGPPGTESMTRHLRRAFEFDVTNRRDVVEKLPAAGAELAGTDVEMETQGARGHVVLDRDGLKILAFPVDHGPDTPAYGYRIEYAGRTAVFSGDSRPTPGLVVQAHGVDVLVHEVVSPALEERSALVSDPGVVERIIARHTSPEEAGRLFALARPRLAVYTHIVPSVATAGDLIPPTRKEFKGRLAVGYDLMMITIGDRITVGRRPTAAERRRTAAAM